MKSPQADKTAQPSGMAAQQVSGPSICIPTLRQFANETFRCGLYEAEDVLAESSGVDVLPLEMGWARHVKQRWLRIPLYHDMFHQLMFRNPGLKKTQLTRKYDVFIAICQNYWDLPFINAIDGWRDQCRTSVCWIHELWAVDLPGYKYWLHALSQFDYVFTTCKDTVEPLSKAIGRTCHWLPGAVDTLRFTPFPKPPARVIDVYSIGRRSEHIHSALLEAARRKEIFYIYDTFSANNLKVYDYREHRDLFANVAKRSRYFTVQIARMDPQITHGQIEVGYRYFEGAAAGAVMIGQAPDVQSFKELFPWPDAVIPVGSDGTGVEEALHDLHENPERLAVISNRNAMEALLRHDWMHRWVEMFHVIGIDPPSGMMTRLQSLKNLADAATVCESARGNRDLSGVTLG
jgi:spore maturation protein CgeB